MYRPEWPVLTISTAGTEAVVAQEADEPGHAATAAAAAVFLLVPSCQAVGRII
jgi:hypothetical protein